MRHFAKRVITYETRESESSGTTPSAGFGVCEKLRPQLVTLMGTGGFLALLSRALVLASAEVSWLGSLKVEEDGLVDESEMLDPQPGPDEMFEGTVVLAAQLLGLLVAFIGENLTLRLVREAWPKLPLNNLNFETGDRNEKAK